MVQVSLHLLSEFNLHQRACEEYKGNSRILMLLMEHGQTIRFYAPAWRVISLSIDPRRGEGWPEGGDPILMGRAERDPADDSVPEDAAVVEFANCRPDAESVARFLKKYGPLWEPDKDGNFAMLLAAFVGGRDHFCYMWDKVLGLPALSEPYKTLESELGVQPRPWRTVSMQGEIKYQATGLVHCCLNLHSALIFKLFAIAHRNWLRRCANPGCSQLRYFVASHGKQKFCSEQCAAWAQAKAKLAWWQSSGSEWKTERAKIRKSRSKVASAKLK